MKKAVVLIVAAVAVTAALAGCGSSKTKSHHMTQPVASSGHTVTDAASEPVDTSGASAPDGSASDGHLSASIATLGRPFAADSPWNTQVTNATLASNSTFLMTQAEKRYGVVVSGNSLDDVTTKVVRIDKPLFINTTVWTDPIVFTGGSTVDLVCRQVNLPPPDNNCGDGWELKSLPIPTNTGFPKPGYDGWFTVFDEATGYAYDFWRARFVSGGSVLSYQFVRRWDIDGTGYLPPNYVGARGSGLPMFAGEILPRDITSGHIDHALAISVPGPASDYYVQPASSTDGNGTTDSLPEGARIRLKSNFDIDAALAKLPGQTNLRAARAVMVALKTYGAIVVDRSAVPTLYAVPDYNWNAPLRNKSGKLLSPNDRTVLPADDQHATRYGTPLLSGNVTSALTLDDFEVIQLPQVLQYPPLPHQSQTSGVDGSQPQAVDGEGTTDSTQITQASSSGVAVGGELP